MATLNEKQLKNMQLMMDALQGGAVMPDELAKVVKVLLDVFKEIKTQLEQTISSTDMKFRLDLSNAIDEIKKLETRLQDSLGEVTNKSQQFSLAEVSKIASKLEKDIEKLKGEMPEMPDLSEIETRLDEMETEVEEIEVPEIEEIEKDLPKLGIPIRDGLELITEESEKLKIEAIGYLRKELDELKKRIATMPRGSYGGGFSVGALNIHLIDWTVLATGDDSTTDFTLTNTPSPVDSLEVKVGGGDVFPTDDYTYTASTRTVSFITAPPTGAKIRYRCRI